MHYGDGPPIQIFCGDRVSDVLVSKFIIFIFINGNESLK